MQSCSAKCKVKYTDYGYSVCVAKVSPDCLVKFSKGMFYGATDVEMYCSSF